MAVKILDVQKNSIADKYHIKPNQTLISINGKEIKDVLDYQFYMTETKLELIVEEIENKILIVKDEYEDLGLEFSTYLMDEKRSCKNKCVFCFVDQMPKGMRESLYFKDDDDRLSFLFGNYITLTNLTDHEIERIIQMKISPINVSVHTTNPELRVKMMKNKNAGRCLSLLKRFADAGIKMNCQLVLCPNINDGEELRKTLTDLANLYPSVENVAAVPVGTTKFRNGLTQLENYNKKTSSEVIDIMSEFSKKFIEKHGVNFTYLGDEFYLIAEKPIPSKEYYGDFLMLENGVGLIRSLSDEFDEALEYNSEIKIQKRKVALATGVAATDLMKNLTQKAVDKWDNLDCEVHTIINDFFGHKITVAGLVVAQDIVNQLKGQDLGDELLLPACMLRHERDKFLDDYDVEYVEKQLNIKIRLVENDGYDVLDALLGV